LILLFFYFFWQVELLMSGAHSPQAVVQQLQVSLETLVAEGRADLKASPKQLRGALLLLYCCFTAALL
jgi:hypothetical protein